jgi:hypothetical protein
MKGNCVSPCRLQVLASLALVAAPFVLHPAHLSSARAETRGFRPPPQGPPLVQLSLNDFLARHGGLTRLKLKMKDATVGEIAAELRRQTGLDFVESRPGPLDSDGGWPGFRISRQTAPDPPEKLAKSEKPQLFSIEAQGELFWEAVRPWSFGEARLSVHQRSFAPARWSIGRSHSAGALGSRSVAVGPCHISLREAKLSRISTRSMGVEASTPYADNSLQLYADLWTDPRFFPFIAAAIVETSATNQWGEPAAFVDSAGSVMELTDARAHHMTLLLRAPDESAKYLALAGTLRLAVVTRRASWEIDLAKTPTASKIFAGEEGEVRARFDGVEKQGDGWIARFKIQRTFATPRAIFTPQVRKGTEGYNLLHWNGFTLSESLSTTRDLHFFNSKGELLQNAATKSSAGDGTGVSTLSIQSSYGIKRDLDLGFGPVVATKYNPPARITLNIPLEWREIQIPFEFKDLPLP